MNNKIFFKIIRIIATMLMVFLFLGIAFASGSFDEQSGECRNCDLSDINPAYDGPILCEPRCTLPSGESITGRVTLEQDGYSIIDGSYNDESNFVQGSLIQISSSGNMIYVEQGSFISDNLMSSGSFVVESSSDRVALSIIQGTASVNVDSQLLSVTGENDLVVINSDGSIFGISGVNSEIKFSSIVNSFNSDVTWSCCPLLISSNSQDLLDDNYIVSSLVDFDVSGNQDSGFSITGADLSQSGILVNDDGTIILEEGVSANINGLDILAFSDNVIANLNDLTSILGLNVLATDNDDFVVNIDFPSYTHFDHEYLLTDGFLFPNTDQMFFFDDDNNNLGEINTELPMMFYVTRGHEVGLDSDQIYYETNLETQEVIRNGIWNSFSERGERFADFIDASADWVEDLAGRLETGINFPFVRIRDFTSGEILFDNNLPDDDFLSVVSANNQDGRPGNSNKIDPRMPIGDARIAYTLLDADPLLGNAQSYLVFQTPRFGVGLDVAASAEFDLSNIVPTSSSYSTSAGINMAYIPSENYLIQARSDIYSSYSNERIESQKNILSLRYQDYQASILHSRESSPSSGTIETVGGSLGYTFPFSEENTHLSGAIGLYHRTESGEESYLYPELTLAGSTGNLRGDASVLVRDNQLGYNLNAYYNIYSSDDTYLNNFDVFARSSLEDRNIGYELGVRGTLAEFTIGRRLYIPVTFEAGYRDDSTDSSGNLFDYHSGLDRGWFLRINAGGNPRNLRAN